MVKFVGKERTGVLSHYSPFPNLCVSRKTTNYRRISIMLVKRNYTQCLCMFILQSNTKEKLLGNWGMGFSALMGGG